MNRERITLKGELYLRLERVAELYEVEVVLLLEATRAGLFPSEIADGHPCIAAVDLDRVATLVRLHRQLGLDLEAIELAWID